MDAFEHIFSKILQDKGYWIQLGYKIELSKEDRRSIGNPTMPRVELDIVAYKPGINELLIVECKSYLDSQGVGHRAFTIPNSRLSKRYKLFTKPELYKLVRKRLLQQMNREGRLPKPNPKPLLCLAAAKIYSDHESQLLEHFDKNKWRLYTPDWIADKIRGLAARGYENEVMTVVTKILGR